MKQAPAKVTVVQNKRGKSTNKKALEDDDVEMKEEPPRQTTEQKTKNTAQKRVESRKSVPPASPIKVKEEEVVRGKPKTNNKRSQPDIVEDDEDLGVSVMRRVRRAMDEEEDYVIDEEEPVVASSKKDVVSPVPAVESSKQKKTQMDKYLESMSYGGGKKKPSRKSR